MTIFHRLLPALAIAAISLSACGGDDSPGADAATTPASTPASTPSGPATDSTSSGDDCASLQLPDTATVARLSGIKDVGDVTPGSASGTCTFVSAENSTNLVLFQHQDPESWEVSKEIADPATELPDAMWLADALYVVNSDGSADGVMVLTYDNTPEENHAADIALLKEWGKAG